MSEAAEFAYHADVFTEAEYLYEIKRQAIDPPGGDVVTGAFFSALYDECERDKGSKNFLLDLYKTKASLKRLSPSHAANETLRLFQMSLMPRDASFPFADDDIRFFGLRQQEDYPESFHNVAKWQDAIQTVFHDRNNRDVYHSWFLILDSQANIASRYVVMKLMNQSLPRRLSSGALRILDIGCSRNHGLAYLTTDASCDNFSIYPDNDYLAKVDVSTEEFKRTVNDAISRPIVVSSSFGIDERPISDPFMSLWQFACSFYPLELANRALVNRYNTLEIIRDNSSEINFIQANLAERNLRGAIVASETNEMQTTQKADAAIAAASMYQSRKDQQQNIHSNVVSWLDTDGAWFVADYCYFDDSNPGGHPINQLVFPHNWFAMSYPFRVFRFRPAEAERGFVELARFKNGRCYEGVLTAEGTKSVITETAR